MKDVFKKSVVAILTFEAQVLLRRTRPKIIAITGSVGKTSTKDAIYTVLKSHMHARKSQKSFNSDIGVALTVLGLPNAGNNPLLWLKNIIDGTLHACFSAGYPEVLILEMGVDRPGDMKRLTTWIKPDVVVLTRLPNVPVHVEYFASPEQVAEEKMQLAYALRPEGVFVYNSDDEIIARYIGEVRQQSFGFSRYSPSHFRASDDTVMYDGAVPIGVQFTLTHVDQTAHARVYGSLGVQHAYNLAAAAAVGTLFNIPIGDSLKELEKHVPPPGRMRIIPGVEDTVLLDDTYNSSPVACEHAVQALSELKNSGRKIAVLGDMLELGQFSVREHERIGELLAHKVDVLVTIGVRARKIAESALEFGLTEKSIFQYDDSDTAAGELKRMVKKGDIILVKASQGIRAEKVVKRLMKEPENAAQFLVRQDDIWVKK